VGLCLYTLCKKKMKSKDGNLAMLMMMFIHHAPPLCAAQAETHDSTVNTSWQAPLAHARAAPPALRRLQTGVCLPNGYVWRARSYNCYDPNPDPSLCILHLAASLSCILSACLSVFCLSISVFVRASHVRVCLARLGSRQASISIEFSI